MKKICKLLFLSSLVALPSCNPNKNNVITTICPLGAPSICYYTEGNNSNFVTNSPTAIVPQFQKSNPDYDALIIDSTTGLAQARKNNSKYKFAKLLTAGNLYLIGLNNNVSAPTKDKVIYGFGENNLTGLVFKHILKAEFDITNINFVDDVSKISPIVINGKSGGVDVDYVLIAEPLLYSCAHASSTHFTEGTNYKVTINELWKEIPSHESSLIPQAALFVNSDSYNKKKSLFSTYIKDLNKRIDTAINDPTEVKNTLDNFARGDETKVVNKFGFKSEIAYNVQKDNNNGFALYSSNEEYTCDKMNTFLKDLGVSTRYEESDFISIK